MYRLSSLLCFWVGFFFQVDDCVYCWLDVRLPHDVLGELDNSHFVSPIWTVCLAREVGNSWMRTQLVEQEVSLLGPKCGRQLPQDHRVLQCCSPRCQRAPWICSSLTAKIFFSLKAHLVGDGDFPYICRLSWHSQHSPLIRGAPSLFKSH